MDNRIKAAAELRELASKVEAGTAVAVAIASLEKCVDPACSDYHTRLAAFLETESLKRFGMTFIGSASLIHQHVTHHVGHLEFHSNLAHAIAEQQAKGATKQ